MWNHTQLDWDWWEGKANVLCVRESSWDGPYSRRGGAIIIRIGTAWNWPLHCATFTGETEDCGLWLLRHIFCACCEEEWHNRPKKQLAVGLSPACLMMLALLSAQPTSPNITGHPGVLLPLQVATRSSKKPAIHSGSSHLATFGFFVLLPLLLSPSLVLVTWGNNWSVFLKWSKMSLCCLHSALQSHLPPPTFLSLLFSPLSSTSPFPDPFHESAKVLKSPSA